MDTWLPTRALAARLLSQSKTLSSFCEEYIDQAVNNKTRTGEICKNLDLDNSLQSVSILALANKTDDKL